MNITLFHHHFRRHTRSLISTRLCLSLSLFLSNLSIRCISFTSAPIFPLSFSSSRAIEGCRRISPLEGVRTEKKRTKKTCSSDALQRREWRRLCCFSSNLRHLPLFARIHDARKIINKAKIIKQYTIRSRRNFNVLTDEYYNL